MASSALPRPTPALPDSVFALFSLKGRTALITGGATGIGAAVARAYAEAGAHVAVAYNSSAGPADALVKELQSSYGVESVAVKIVADDPESVERGVQSVVERWGKLDIAVANAGTTGSFDIAGASLDAWKKVNSVNYDGVFYLARVVGPIFKKQGSGNFIATASMSGSIVNVPKNQAAYNATKAAVIHFCKSLAVEWKAFARVNTVSPGYIDTGMMGGAAPGVLKASYEMPPLGRHGHVKELKGIYLYLASDASTFTTGADFIVDGGYTLP